MTVKPRMAEANPFRLGRVVRDRALYSMEAMRSVQGSVRGVRLRLSLLVRTYSVGVYSTTRAMTARLEDDLMQQFSCAGH
jgi:hypothetical protein